MPILQGNYPLANGPASRRKLFEQEWLGEVVALRITDARCRQQVSKLFKALDSFGNDRDTQRVAHRFDRPEDALTARTFMNIGDERSVDLYLVGGDVGEHRKRRVTSAEIIDGDANAGLPEHRQHFHLKPVLGNERVLGNLDDETGRMSARLQAIDDRSHERHVSRLTRGDVYRNRCG